MLLPAAKAEKGKDERGYRVHDLIEELIAVDEVQPLIGLEYLIRIAGNLHQRGASRHQLFGKQIDERQIAKIAVIWDSDCLRRHKIISNF
ncbi:MAG TPA: hypothetical protein DEO95_06825 [Ruminococcaceae bacterium]|nr:hypothetical protein [Oscillospiraceae bacterium]